MGSSVKSFFYTGAVDYTENEWPQNVLGTIGINWPYVSDKSCNKRCFGHLAVHLGLCICPPEERKSNLLCFWSSLTAEGSIWLLSCQFLHCVQQLVANFFSACCLVLGRKHAVGLKAFPLKTVSCYNKNSATRAVRVKQLKHATKLHKAAGSCRVRW